MLSQFQRIGGELNSFLCILLVQIYQSLNAKGCGRFRVVWSCILRGKVKPDTAKFETEEGSDMIPIVRFEAEKEDYGERWGGFILQIGEDSIL